MAHKKRGKKLFNWNKSELPDSDANTQVLLLGVTRLDTPPRSLPPKLAKPKQRPHTYHASTAIDDPTPIIANDVDASVTKTATDRKFHSSHYLTDHRNDYDALWSNRPVPKSTAFLSFKSKRNLNTFLGRFNRNSSEKAVGNGDAAAKRLIDRPLVDEQRHDEKRATHVERDDIQATQRSIRVKKSKASRLSSCIPSCANRHESSEAAIDSLASSFRIAECCSPITSNGSSRNYSRSSTYRREHQQRQHLIAQLNRLRSPNEIIAGNSCRSSDKTTLRNRNSNVNATTTNNNSNLFNNLNIMDRSVDSIGSCSLDVDAESTDFSDTSGSLNVCTPLSGKDFTREFTSRIHERCQLPVHAQQTKTVLDPNSGKISTIILPPIAIDDALSPQATPPAKKPSYLNLACCVNGYSNLTTYDSKFRQSINKSREVSPIRPITHTVQYNRGESNYLVVPVSMPIINDHTRTTSMMDAHTILSPEKRFYSQQTQQKSHDISSTTVGRDITDNISNNGCTKFFTKAMLSTPTTTTTTTTIKDGANDISTKSFIQQRVERLYGPGALAQGIYSPKKPKQFEENCGSVSLASILVEKSQNSSKFNGYATSTMPTNGSSAIDVENVNVDASNETPLPVLRHLRPEFRAQLPMLSPKRSTPVKGTAVDIASMTMTTTTTTTTTTAIPSPNNGKFENGIDASPSNGVGSNSHCNEFSSNGSIVKSMTNGCIDTQTKYRISNAGDENSLTSTKCVTEYGNEVRHTLKNNGSASVGGGDNDCSNSSNSSHNISISDIINSMSNVRLNDLDRSHCELSVATASPPKRSTIVEASKTAAKSPESDSNGNLKTETQTKDALYYLNTVHSERDRLIAMAVEIEKELDELLQRDDIDDEVLGHLRSAAGKARLLATQKFKQFEGLCNKSLDPASCDSFAPPTPQDLQGFWEMVLLQVNHVDSLNTELATYRANDWKKPAQDTPKAAPQGSKITKRSNTSRASATSSAATTAATAKKSAAAIAAAQKREEQRKKLLEMKRKNKLAMTADAPAIILEHRNGKNSVDSRDGQSNETNETDR